MEVGVIGVGWQEHLGNRIVTFGRLAGRDGPLDRPISSRRSTWESEWIEERGLEKAQTAHFIKSRADD